MLSAILKHLEEFSKTFDIEKYCECIDKNASIIENEQDEKGFYSVLLEATFSSIKQFNHDKIKFNAKNEYAKLGEKEKFEFVRTYGIMSMINDWLRYKQIYKFDLDTLEMLITSEFKNLTYAELKALKMPYDCITIENDFLYDKNFLFLNETLGTTLDCVILRRRFYKNAVHLTFFGFIKDTSDTAILLEIKIEEGETIADGIKRRGITEAQEVFVKNIMNLLMYLCQPKVEIVKKHIDKGEKEDKPKKIKHYYKVNYDENIVGLKLGSAIRNYKIVYEKHVKSHKGIGTKRPHIRCGHFQGYWTGKGRTTLVPKYIEPIFVLGGNKTATLHKVKK